MTDAYMSPIAVGYTPLAKLALRYAVIKIVNKSSRVNFNRNKNKNKNNEKYYQKPESYNFYNLYSNSLIFPGAALKNKSFFSENR